MVSLPRMRDERVRILQQFVRSRLAVDRPVTADTRLVSDGLLDSMGLVLLAAFAEERFGVRLDDADLRDGQLETIANIVALIDRRS